MVFQKGHKINLGRIATKETIRKMKENHADFSGKNNPMYGKKRLDISEYNKIRKDKTYEEIYGIEKAKELKIAQSISRKGRAGWNTGLTKETDERVKRQSKGIKKIYEEGYVNPFKGKERPNIRGDKNPMKREDVIIKHNNSMNTEEFKRNHSVRMKLMLKEHPEKHPNRIMGKKGFVSYPQKELFKIIKLFNNEAELNYPIITPNHTYFGDVVIPSLKLCFEYDGEHWHNESTKEKDLVRQKNIEEQRFRVIRFDKEKLKELKEWIDIPLWRL